MHPADRRIAISMSEFILSPLPWIALAAVLALALLRRSRRRAVPGAAPATVTAHERLQRENRELRDLMAGTVHELRTPLTTVLAAIELLQGGHAKDPAEREEFLNQGLAGCHHMMFLLNDLLDHAALESGKLRLEHRDCPVGELLGEAVRLLRPFAIARGVRLQIEVPAGNPAVRGDRRRILQVAFNLLGNAMKFSPPEGKVVLRAARREATVRFEVLDEGSGVPADKRGLLFTKFGQLHQERTPAPHGTGLGLWLSRTLVEQMGGTIGYAPRTDVQGSVFWFEMPCSEPAAKSLDRVLSIG